MEIRHCEPRIGVKQSLMAFPEKDCCSQTALSRKVLINEQKNSRYPLHSDMQCFISLGNANGKMREQGTTF